MTDNNNNNRKEYKDLKNRVVKPLEQPSSSSSSDNKKNVNNNNYPDNTVCNSRYTAFSFLPKNLYEQFRRPLNMYFLFVACLQFISIIAPVSPLSTLLPLLVAFSVTAIKEGFDDIKRHRSDDEYNSRTMRVLRDGTWRECTSASLKVGDVIDIRQDQEIPCDCICIAAPTDEVQMSPSGTIYIRTENLDGEMDLKSRDTAPTSLCTETASVHDIINACRGFTFNYPPPSPSLSQFDAQIYIGQEMLPLTPNHLLYQSAYLKNVQRIFAVVVYTGNETRVGMNKRPAPQKWAAIDQNVSKYSIFIFVCQMILAFSLGLAGFLRNRSNDDWYLGGSDKGNSDTVKNAGGIIFPARFFLLTSVMIPISFKFIVDVSKYWMSLVLEWDLSMWDDEREMGMKVKNSSIVEDLAQVQYVLSDKTGTLTQNIMSLHSLSTGAPALYRMEELTSRLSPAPSMNFRCAPNNNNNAATTTTSTVLTSSASTTASPTARSNNINKDDNNNNNSSTSTSDTFFKNAGNHPQNSLHQQTEEDAPNLTELLVAMSICNTCTLHHHTNSNASGADADSSNNIKSKVDFAQPDFKNHYQSPSPDEECLCSSAATQGVVLETRDKKSMKIRFTSTSCLLSSSSAVSASASSNNNNNNNNSGRSGDVTPNSNCRSYTIHHVFEFSSDRKCMSIVLTDNDSNVTWLYSKGADDRILANLVPSVRSSSPRVSQCCNDVNAFAHQGLRTLMFARRRISAEELRSFEEKYDAARTSTENRSEKMTGVQAEFEKNLEFLGASGVEDKLQENVNGSVNQIINGNIKFWMLTGDKVETAKQIAVSCGLFPASVVVPDANNRDKENPNLIEISGPEGVAALRGMNPNKIPEPPGAAEKEMTAQMKLHPLGWCSTRVPPKVSGSGLPLLKHERPTTYHLDQQSSVAGNKNNNNNQVGGGDAETGMYLVVEGGAVLEQILNDPLLAPRLFEIAKRCVSVVCARVTPGQKAAIAAKVKSSGYMTLCIGDGGNDVAMIQESHVGVGILGREGQQAARAADFAIVNFKDLTTLLFVHGHMSYMRTSYIVLYSFYKSMLISAIQILYNIFFANLSGVSFWNSFVLTMWNGAFTLPQTICFVLDRCVPREVLVRYPILYRLSQANYGFTPTRFSGFLFMGMFQSAALLLMVYLTFGDDHGGSFVADPADGQASSLGTVFTSSYSALLLLQIPLVIMYSSSITLINAFWIFLMPCGYAALMAIYSLLKNLDYYQVWFKSETTPYVAFAFIVAAILVLPPFLWKCFSELVTPNAAWILRRLWVQNGSAHCVGTSGDNNQLSVVQSVTNNNSSISHASNNNNNNNHNTTTTTTTTTSAKKVGAISSATKVESAASGYDNTHAVADAGRFSDV